MVTFQADTLIPVMKISPDAFLNFYFFDPGIFPGRLVKMPVDADMHFFHSVPLKGVFILHQFFNILLLFFYTMPAKRLSGNLFKKAARRKEEDKKTRQRKSAVSGRLALLGKFVGRRI